MQQLVKLSSKRQITIPAELFRRLNLKQNDTLLLELNDDVLEMRKAQSILDNLEGSIRMPEHYKGKDVEFIIRDAKQKYFAAKK